MTHAEELRHVAEAARRMNYTADQLEDFSNEYGWQKWMDRHTDAANRDGQVVTDEEAAEINAIVAEGFALAFAPPKKRGGARPNSGRKKSDNPMAMIFVRLPRNVIEKIERHAAECGLTRSEYIRVRLSEVE